MINAHSEMDFLYRGMRALIGFRTRAGIAWFRNGHLIRAKAIRKYLANHSETKLQLGGTYMIEGFLNSQIVGDVPIDITSRLPLPDSSFSLIYSSHLVEHIHRKQFASFLADSFRVLKPNGIHIVATPSIEKISRTIYGPPTHEKTLLMDSGSRFYPETFHTESQQLNLSMRAFGHRFLYDLAFMRAAAAEAGFSSVESVDNLELPDKALSRYIKAKKPPRWNAETETFIFRTDNSDG